MLLHRCRLYLSRPVEGRYSCPAFYGGAARCRGVRFWRGGGASHRRHTQTRARAHTHTGAHVQLSIAAIEEGWRCKNAPTAAVTASAAAAQAPAATWMTGGPPYANALIAPLFLVAGWLFALPLPLNPTYSDVTPLNGYSPVIAISQFYTFIRQCRSYLTRNYLRVIKRTSAVDSWFCATCKLMIDIDIQ